MAAAPPRIGARLRAARRDRGLSLAELAERSGLTKGFLSEVERDLTSPSVGSLLRLCAALGLPVGELFDADQGPVVRAAERTPVAFGGQGVDEFQLTPAGERRVLVLQSDIGPGGGSGDEPYSLGSDAEFVHVLEGTLDIEVAGTRYRLSAGDSLTFDAAAPHTWGTALLAAAAHRAPNDGLALGRRLAKLRRDGPRGIGHQGMHIVGQARQAVGCDRRRAAADRARRRQRRAGAREI